MVDEDSSAVSEHTIGRRRFLGGLTVASVPFVAGCTSPTEEAGVATPVYIPTENREALGVQQNLREEQTTVVEDRSFGLRVSATVTSRYAIYEERPAGRAGGLLVSALSTPRTRVLFEERNPLAGLSGQRFLSSDQVQWFREPAGLSGIDRDWVRNSTRLHSDWSEILGERTRVTARAGVFDADSDPSVLFAHYASFQIDDDHIFIFAVRHWDVETADKPLVGADGYVTETEFAADLVGVQAVFGGFVHG